MQLNRRKAVIGIGSIATGTIAVNTLSGTSEAAQVQLDDLTIQDNSQMVTDPLTDVRLQATCSYEYTSNRAPEEWELLLEVGTHPDEMNTIAKVESTETFETDSGEESLNASLLNSPDFDLEMFQPSTSETRSVSFLVSLTFKLFGSNEVQDSSYVEDTVTVEITNGTYEISSAIGGTGNVSVQT